MLSRPTCESCPYFQQSMANMGECRIGPDYISRLSTDWCGEHPDFPRAVAPVEPVPDAPAEPQTAAQTQRRRKPVEDN